MRSASRRIPAGAWLVGGNWGAYAQWAQGSAGAEAAKTETKEFLPDKALVDPVTGDHPALISRFDQQLHLGVDRFRRQHRIGIGACVDLAARFCEAPDKIGKFFVASLNPF